MKKIFIAIISILLLSLAVVFFGTGKTTGKIESFATNLCRIANHTFGQSYYVGYTVGNENYFGNSECTKTGLIYGNDVAVHYAKFNKNLIVPFHFLIGALSGLTAFTVLLFGILLIVGKKTAKE